MSSILMSDLSWYITVQQMEMYLEMSCLNNPLAPYELFDKLAVGNSIYYEA